MIVLTENEILSPDDLPVHFKNETTEYILPNPKQSNNNYNELEFNEKKIIERILKEEKYNKSKTAKRLGITRKTLYDKIKKYEITL